MIYELSFSLLRKLFPLFWYGSRDGVEVDNVETSLATAAALSVDTGVGTIENSR